MRKSVFVSLLLPLAIFPCGCLSDFQFPDNLIESTVVRQQEIEVAWFDRETPATVGFVYVLKARYRQGEWTTIAIFDKIDLDRTFDMPRLKLDSQSLYVDFSIGKVYHFDSPILTLKSPKDSKSSSSESIKLHIHLVKSPEERYRIFDKETPTPVPRS